MSEKQSSTGRRSPMQTMRIDKSIRTVRLNFELPYKVDPELWQAVGKIPLRQQLPNSGEKPDFPAIHRGCGVHVSEMPCRLTPKPGLKNVTIHLLFAALRQQGLNLVNFYRYAVEQNQGGKRWRITMVFMLPHKANVVARQSADFARAMKKTAASRLAYEGFVKTLRNDSVFSKVATFRNPAVYKNQDGSWKYNGERQLDISCQHPKRVYDKNRRTAPQEVSLQGNTAIIAMPVEWMLTVRNNTFQAVPFEPESD